MRTLIAIIKAEYDENGPDPVNPGAFDALFDRAQNVEIIDVDDRALQEDGRWWILDSPTDTNRLAEVRDVAGNKLVALVDEQSGGVVGYVLDEVATGIAVKLNREPT